MTETPIGELVELVADFIRRRDWNKYHTPKNLAMSISIEAAEIMELFQWVTTEEALENALTDPSLKIALENELADVMIYCLSMANSCDINITHAIRRKLAENETRFPVKIVAGKLGPYKINEKKT